MKTALNLALLVSVLAPVLAIGATASAQGRAFTVHNNGGSRVQFVSDAPLETITGVSSNVEGNVTLDPANVASARGRVKVSIASLRTGIDLRDEHVRSPNWLDATRFPDATFEITGVEGATRLVPNENTEVRIRGRFTLHGVTREVVANARVRFVPFSPEMRAARVNGDVVMVQARFDLRLTDFGVQIPEAVQLKVSNEIQVNVALRATVGT